MIRAISFDVWDCLLVDDSDEPKRAALGLRPKVVARREAFVAEVLRHRPELVGAAPRAWDDATAWAEHRWHQECYTPMVPERLDHAYAALGIEQTPGFGELVRCLEHMEVVTPPDPAPGVHRMLEVLVQRYALAIVSDAIVTPGPGLRQILGRHGLAHYFQFFGFSDELGASKPAPVGFQRVCGAFGIEPGELVHVGDRLEKDVVGARSVGARGVLYTGVKDRGGAEQADAHCAHWHDFAAVLEGM